MSVEIAGPRGYEFQYLNSLLVALEYLDKGEVEVYIEKEEDAQIIFNEDSKKYIIDIQVKHRNKEIDIEEFAQWISHFESRSTECCLLNKMQQDNRFAVFISNARCKDKVSPFIDKGAINVELDKWFNNQYLDYIKMCIKNCYNDTKDISKKRNKYLNEFVENTTNRDLRNILKKVKIRENYTEDNSINSIKSVLNKNFHVPQSSTDKVILELLDKIREQIGSDKSIAEELIRIISRYSSKFILNRNEYYVQREEKELCKNKLESENILLLTGVSFCGKSYLAKDIAQDYLDEGYNVIRTGELYGDSGATQFITSRDIEDRLLILEDPFGQVETKKDATGILRKVSELLREAKCNRKIIITSRKDIVVSLFQRKSIEECVIDTYNWIDLTKVKIESIKNLWQKYYGMSEKSMKIYKKMMDWIKRSERKSPIPLGHISNIYNSNKSLDKLDSLEISKVISSARIDSNDLSNIIDTRGNIARKVFITLGLCCNTYKQISFDDLAFILNDSEECLGMITEDVIRYEDFDLSKLEDELDKNNEVDLKYNLSYKISDEVKNQLKYLMDYGYIEIDNAKRIMFSHPIYHYASQLLFKKYFNDVFENEQVIKIVKRSLGSLSVNSQLCTLEVLENYYEENPNKEIKRLILKSLNSIFPSSRDKVIMFFDRRINDLDEDEQKYFIKQLKLGNNIENIKVCWDKGIPYFKEFEHTHSLHYDILESKTIDKIRKKVNNGVILSSEEMWKLLNVINNKDICIEILEQAMIYDESFIRGKAVELIFKNYAFEFSKDKMDEYLNKYEHHNVIYSLFKGAISSWLKYNEYSRRKIINYFENSLDIMSVSIKAGGILENFEKDYLYAHIDWSEMKANEKEVLWNTWYEVYVSFFNKFPSKYSSMDEVHMANVIDKSLEFIKSEEKVVKLATVWFNWLHRQVNYSLPNDYAMSVARYLMKGTGYKSSYRQEVFKQMLSTTNTSFITSNISTFIEYWDKLSENEKKAILNLYKEKRNDIKWIKAVSLNVDRIPLEIQVEVLGQVINNKSIPNIVDILIKNDLLEQCLNIYCGYPQPLCWNGYHHKNEKLWDEIIVEVLKRNELNNSYKIALKEIMDLLYNHDKIRINNIYYIYEEILLKNDEKRKLVFEELMNVTVNQNQSNKKLWDLLFRYSSQEEIEFYYNRIAEDIELIQYKQYGYEDLFGLFDEEMIFREIYPRLENDNKIKEIVTEVLKVNSSIIEMKQLNYKELEQTKNISELIKKCFEQILIYRFEKDMPRLFLTNKIVKYTINKLNIKSSKLESLIEKNRRRLIDIASKLGGKYDDHYDLDDWNS